MRELLSPLPLFFLSCLILVSVSVLVVPVKGVSYFNWIKNADFECWINLCEDGSFESGEYETGVQYGNWSGTCGFSQGQVYSGVYSIYGVTGNYLWYNLSESVLGANLINFSAMVYPINEYYDGTLYIYYSDYSYDQDTYALGASQEWHKVNWLGFVNPAKYVVAFKVQMTGVNSYFDDVILATEDFDGQEQISYVPLTFPWYGFGGSYGGLNTVWGRNSHGCSYMGYADWWRVIIQDIDYLDSDTVHFVDLWAFTPAIGNIGVKVNVIYSDRSVTSKTVELVGVGAWEHLFFSGFISANKYIIQVQWCIAEEYAQYVSVDDFGLWCSVPSNYFRFSFSLSPYPISSSHSGFWAYQVTNYALNCYLYDESGSKTESGQYQIVDDFGTHSGSFTDGSFSFSLAQRVGVQDFEESIAITMVVSDEVVSVTLVAHWVFVGVDVDVDVDGVDGWITVPNYIQFSVLFMICGLPAVVLSMAGAKAGWGLQGLLFGAFLGVSVGVMVGIVPFWFVFLIGLFLIVFLYSLVKRS